MGYVICDCDICGDEKKCKCYELVFRFSVTDSIFICRDCLPVQKSANFKENIKMIEK